MFGLSLLQEVLFTALVLLLFFTLFAGILRRAWAFPAIFCSLLLVVMIFFDLFPGVLGYVIEGQPGQNSVYLRFDILLIAFAVLAYAYATREYKHHQEFAGHVRSQALALAELMLEAQSKVPSGMTRVVILITARNEAESIGEVLAALPTQVGNLEFKTLVVDDGSSDATPLIAREAGALVVRHGTSLGVGAPLTTGFVAAMQLNCQYLIHIDADGQHNPDDLMRILAPLIEGRADMIIGSRFREIRPTHLSATRSIGIRLYTRLVNFLTGYTITDATSGYWGIRAERIPDISFHAEYNFAVEMLLRAGKNKVRLDEVPVVQLPRLGGHSQFHSISLFLLYHPRAVAQIISAYTRPGPKFPIFPRVSKSDPLPRRGERVTPPHLLETRVRGDAHSDPAEK